LIQDIINVLVRRVSLFNSLLHEHKNSFYPKDTRVNVVLRATYLVYVEYNDIIKIKIMLPLNSNPRHVCHVIGSFDLKLIKVKINPIILKLNIVTTSINCELVFESLIRNVHRTVLVTKFKRIADNNTE